ncbi:hypothetical protein [Mesorhizobium sp. SP-1A]|jgi:hypothetical protein|uniref:hypothetical protein n=1 Tax=Mesorhizobium sp. SP-1A TaxID=3077840 RepID=UPI0028F7475D|nr:hypothetical protein [Mesorhizobium sp. SP-1A]
MTRTARKKPAKPPDDQALSGDIRRQATDRMTRRFLRGMPAFKVVSDLPEHMKTLLERLENVEPGHRSRG